MYRHCPLYYRNNILFILLGSLSTFHLLVHNFQVYLTNGWFTTQPFTKNDTWLLGRSGYGRKLKDDHPLNEPRPIFRWTQQTHCLSPHRSHKMTLDSWGKVKMEEKSKLITLQMAQIQSLGGFDEHITYHPTLCTKWIFTLGENFHLDQVTLFPTTH